MSLSQRLLSHRGARLAPRHVLERMFHGTTRAAQGFELSSEWIRPNGANEETLVVCLHGLLGNKRNVKSFTNAVCQSLGVPGLLMDVRGHGESQLPAHLEAASTTWEDCVADVKMTLQSEVDDLEDRNMIMIGHSMGGRVTMNYALSTIPTNVDENDAFRPSHIWLLDTVPGNLSSSVLHVMNVAQTIADDESKASMKRNELTKYLVNEKGLDLGTSQWLSSAYDPKQHKFNFDLKVANDLVEQFAKMDYLDWIQRGRTEGDFGIHMVRGGANKSWEKSGTMPQIEQWETETGDSKRFSFHTLPKAGHWVHIDDPKGLVAAVESIHK